MATRYAVIGYAVRGYWLSGARLLAMRYPVRRYWLRGTSYAVRGYCLLGTWFWLRGLRYNFLSCMRSQLLWQLFFLYIYRGYYTVARRYKFYVRVARTISRE